MCVSAQSPFWAECEESSSVTTVLLTDSLVRVLLWANCCEKRRPWTAELGVESQTSLTVLSLCMCEWVVFTQPTAFGREWWVAGVVQLLSGLKGGEWWKKSWPREGGERVEEGAIGVVFSWTLIKFCKCAYVQQPWTSFCKWSMSSFVYTCLCLFVCVSTSPFRCVGLSVCVYFACVISEEEQVCV